MALNAPSLPPRTRAFGALACLIVLASLAQPARAALEEHGNVVRDTETNLEWLRMTLTDGMSVNQALAQFGSEGFRLATNQEVLALVENGGLIIGGAWDVEFVGSGYRSTANVAAVRSFIELIGMTDDADVFVPETGSFVQWIRTWGVTKGDAPSQLGGFTLWSGNYGGSTGAFSNINFTSQWVYSDDGGETYREWANDTADEHTAVWLVRGTDSKTAQSIEFVAPSSMPLGDLGLSATASSGLPVTFEVVSGPGTISGNTLTATDFGEITVRASQAGDAQYGAAPNVDKSIRAVPNLATVTALAGTVTATDLFGNVVQLKVGDPIHAWMTVSTALQSYVHITVPDGSRIQIGPKSTLQITYDDLYRTINLHEGFIWINKTKPISFDDLKLYIKTKIASIGVRGTTLTVELTEDNGMYTIITEVLEGVVDHKNLLTGGTTALGAGDLLSVEGVDPTPARLAKIAALKRKLKIYKKQRDKRKIARTNRSIRALNAQLAGA